MRALSRLVRWVGMWPSKQLHTFVLDIFGNIGSLRYVTKALSFLVRVAKDRAAVLKAVAEANLISIVKKLPIPMFRSQLESIFFFLLYGHQHSQSMFVKLAAELPAVLGTLQSEGVTARLSWEKLAEAGM